MMPVTRKTLEQMNEYYAEVISGLILSDQQHCQMESAIMTKITENKKAQKGTKKNSSSMVGYE